ncbi:MAG: outer membrane beta-barrel protein [Candidatus Latescibacteria bacterium]|nr:outer membrane beta-barrel protein [Candidatus Latescibacterota bacterium]
MDWSNTTTIVNPATVSLEDQFQDNATDHWTVSVFPTIVQKVRPFWYLSAGVRIGSNNNALNRNQGKFRGLGTAVDSLSAYFETSEMFIKPSLSLRRSTAKSQVNLTLGSSWSRFDRVLDKTSLLKSDYLYLIPGFNYSSNYRQGRRVGLNYSSSVNMPNVNQLLPFTNTNNQLLQYRGNADLKPEYRHNLDLSWSLFDHFSFTSLFTRVRGAYTRNRISLSRSVNSDFTQVISPVNIDGHYSAMTYISFSTPVRKLGLTLNAVSSETVSRSKSIINGVDNIETVLSHTVDLNIENRRKGSLDLRIGGEINVTDTRYSISAGNVFSNTKYYGKVRFTPSANWRFETDANVVDYNSRSFNQSVRIPLINGSISYDFLRGKKASFTLHSFDLLNRNTGFQRASATSYLQEREWNTIGRYVMLTLNIRMGR